MMSGLKFALSALILSGFLVVSSHSKALAEVTQSDLAVITQQFSSLVQAGDIDAINAWLAQLAKQYPDDSGTIIVQLNDLVPDGSPIFELIIAALASQLATAAGGPPGGQVFPPGFTRGNANPTAINVTAENPSVVSASPAGPSG